jgi:hypothetical protein
LNVKLAGYGGEEHKKRHLETSEEMAGRSASDLPFLCRITEIHNDKGETPFLWFHGKMEEGSSTMRVSSLWARPGSKQVGQLGRVRQAPHRRLSQEPARRRPCARAVRLNRPKKSGSFFLKYLNWKGASLQSKEGWSKPWWEAFLTAFLIEPQTPRGSWARFSSPWFTPPLCNSTGTPWTP